MEGSVAIIGMSCRFPGGSNSPEKLWKMCEEARDCWSEVPKGRYNIDGFYHPDPDRNGSVNVRGGYFLHEDLALFDASFFSIRSSEAIGVKAMDPQQRLLLECTYEALENGGIAMEKLAGRRCGVFVGSFNRDYKDELQRDPEAMPLYHVTGTEQSMLANRISYVFDFRGPSISLDTACSASMTALHLACQSINSGECQQAIVGGSSLMLNPNLMITMSALRFFSADARSYAFDSRACGYARGEGVACLLLKSLKTAIADGDPIRGVLRGTGINQDGKTPGITVPSGIAQEDLVRTVYQAAGLDPQHTTYVEAHGTGTPTGDPIEARAISRVFNEKATRAGPLLIGSIKTNIGHLEGASGVAGVIKTVLMLERGKILPNLNYEKPNDKIDMEKWGLQVATSVRAWPDCHLRRASVNSFGFGGANAHAIIDAYANDIALLHDGKDSEVKRDERLFLITANDADAGKAYARSLSSHLESCEIPTDEHAVFLSRLAFTLGERRSHHLYRLAVSASSITQLCASLSGSGLSFTKSCVNPQLVYVFTGQGAQWFAMGRELIKEYPVFRTAIARAEAYLKSLGASWSLHEELLKDEETSKVNLATMSQSMCSALQLALVDLLQSWGLNPDKVVGHSSGEIAAAYAIGALSFENCLKVAYYRGIASDELTKNHPSLEGGMLAIGAPAEDVSGLLESVTGGKLAIACFNGPSSITVSGDNAGIEQLHQLLMDRGIFNRRLRVAHAYHSHHMALAESTYRKLLGTIHTTNDSQGEMWSSLTAGRIDPMTLNNEYWVNNLLAPVKFSQALGRLLETCTSDSYSLIEVGPHSALRGPVEDLLAVLHKSHQTSYSSTLLRLQPATKTMLDLAGKLFSQGHKVNMSAVNLRHKATSEDVLTNLPPYVWNHSQRFWHETRYGQDYLNRAESRSDFLGATSPDSSALEPRWRNMLSISEVPWIQDHVIQSQIVYPAAGYVSMAIEGSVRIAAARQISPSVHIVREMSIVKALVIPKKGTAIETVISFRPYNESHRSWSDLWNEFRISSWTSESGWTEHCRGLVSSQTETKHNEVDGYTALHKQDKTHTEPWRCAAEECTELVDVDQFYRQLFTIGMEFGPTFKCVTSAWTGEHTAVGQITPADTASTMPSGFESSHIIHPATLDSMFQTVLLALYGKVRLISRPLVPIFIKELTISGTPRRSPQKGWTCQTVASSKPPREVVACLTAHEIFKSGLKIEAKGLRGVLLEPETTKSEDSTSHNRVCTMLWDIDVEISPEACFELYFGSLARGKAHTSKQTMALEAAAWVYMVEALKKTDQKDIDPQSEHLAKLYHWMKQQEDVGISADGPRRDQHYPHEDQVPLGEEGLMLDRIGKNLDKILQGHAVPLALITEDNLIERYYCNKSVLSDANANAANYVKRLSHKHPNMNILEVGAGTGSATFHILQELGGLHDAPPRFTRYTFTDISATFIEQARVRFSRWGKLVEFGRLNIEISPYMQGFTPGSYDLIIAANVLHATSELKRTLKNVRSLLKPGGKLLLVEMTKDMLHLHLVWGTLPGWWYGVEDFRQSSPLVSRNMWQSLLIESGFSGLDAVIGNSNDEDEHYCSTMVSTATVDSAAEYPPTDIVLHGFKASHGVGRLADLLKATNSHEPLLTELADTGVEEKTYIVLVHEKSLQQPLAETYAKIQDLLTTAKGILWVCQVDSNTLTAAEADLVIGLARTLRNENPLMRFATLNLDTDSGRLDTVACGNIVRVWKACFNSRAAINGVDLEYRVRKGIVEIPRMINEPQINASIASELGYELHITGQFYQNNRPLHLEVETPGLLDSLHFVDDTKITSKLPENFVELEVKSSGINFREIMVATGHLDLDEMGTECSGIITAVGGGVRQFKPGDKVFGFAANSYARSLRCPAAGLYRIPNGLSFPVAASLPVVYCTVMYALVDIANVRAGETVLIHAAAGGVGQAAIMLCQHLGAEIFVTVGTLIKKKFLMETYGVAEQNIFFSRDASFAELVMARTSGRGVDVILNSLAGEQLRHSWNCIAPFGRFLEIGKRDMALNTRLEMNPFFRNVIFASIDLILIRNQRIGILQRLLGETCKLLADGCIKPVQPIHTVSFAEIEGAFRKLQNGQEYGKFIAVPNELDMVKIRTRRPDVSCIRSDATYMVVGGFGGLGRTMTRWLVDSGARNIVLVSRGGPQSQMSKDLLTELKKRNVRVCSEACDIADSEKLENLLDRVRAMNMPQIRGVIQGAMVLRDSPFESMPLSDWCEVLRPKVQGSINLHNLLSKTELDFFVLLSSASGVIGNRGQAAYAAASTFLDAFALYRRNSNLPAMSLDLGVIRGVGYVAENRHLISQLDQISFDEMAEDEMLALIKVAIEEQTKPVHTHQITAGLGLSRKNGSINNPDQLPYWADDPKFSHLRAQALFHSSSSSGQLRTTQAGPPIRQLLREASTLETATELIADQIAKKVAAVLGMAEADIKVEESLSNYGVDSLAAVELRNWVRQEMESTVRLFELLADVPMRDLACKIARKSKLVSSEAKER